MYKYQYYNANPLGNRVDDCTVRAISLATGRSWDSTYDRLSEYAQTQAIMPNDVEYIDEFLNLNYQKVYSSRDSHRVTVAEFLSHYPRGTYLITMNGHITCAIDGCVYDTFDPGDRIVWDAYKIEKDLLR